MAEFLNFTGLTYYHDRIKNLFALQSGLDALQTEVDQIIAAGGEANVIETVKVNGAALTPDAQKAVNVETAQLVLQNNNSNIADAKIKKSDNQFINFDFSNTYGVRLYAKNEELTREFELADTNYVDQNGGKIDTIKINGEALTPDSQKAVNIPFDMNVGPYSFATEGENHRITLGAASGDSDTVEFTYYHDNMLQGTINIASTDYVDQNGGKIDKIKVNGIEQAVSNKEVDLTVPTAMSELTNDSDYQTGEQVQTSIDAAVARVYKFKASVDTVEDLPTTGLTEGDVYDVRDTGMNYAWNGSSWDALGQFIDVSALWSKTELTAVTTAQIDTLFA